MPPSESTPFERELQQLTASLTLPGARLSRRWLDNELLALWLLDVDDHLTLDTQAIGRFWQRLPFWAFAWAGGRALACYIANNHHLVEGKRVLDFGCGSGIAGIAAGMAGASEVWVADLDPNALMATRVNAALNGIDVQVVSQGDDWPEVDVVLAADVLYDISSSADLQPLTLSVPEWLLAESEKVAPDFVDLQCLDSIVTSTLPMIGDFDEKVHIGIYCRNHQVTLN